MKNPQNMTAEERLARIKSLEKSLERFQSVAHENGALYLAAEKYNAQLFDRARHAEKTCSQWYQEKDYWFKQAESLRAELAKGSVALQSLDFGNPEPPPEAQKKIAALPTETVEIKLDNVSAFFAAPVAKVEVGDRVEVSKAYVASSKVVGTCGTVSKVDDKGPFPIRVVMDVSEFNTSYGYCCFHGAELIVLPALKFKLGDRVRLNDTSGFTHQRGQKGTIARVNLRTSHGYPYRVDVDGASLKGLLHREDELDALPAPQQGDKVTIKVPPGIGFRAWDGAVGELLTYTFPTRGTTWPVTVRIESAPNLRRDVMFGIDVVQVKLPWLEVV